MELLPDRFGETAYRPEAYILVGSTIYAGAGMGLIRTDGDFADVPVLCLQGRFESRNAAQCLRRLSANYRFNDSAQLEDDDTDIDTDTIFFGAALRFAL